MRFRQSECTRLVRTIGARLRVHGAVRMTTCQGRFVIFGEQTPEHQARRPALPVGPQLLPRLESFGALLKRPLSVEHLCPYLQCAVSAHARETVEWRRVDCLGPDGYGEACSKHACSDW